MTNEVIWTKIVLERFIELANLTQDEEIVIRTRVAGWSRVKQAMELNLSVSTIDRIISRLKRKYDEVQKFDPMLPPRKKNVYH
jgi:DNA-binding NarL/FixJ family response regulator